MNSDFDEKLGQLLSIFEGEHSFEIISNSFEYNNYDIQKTIDALIELSNQFKNAALSKSSSSSSSPVSKSTSSNVIDLTQPISKNPKVEKLRLKFLSKYNDLLTQDELNLIWKKADKELLSPKPEDVYNYAEMLLHQFLEDKFTGESNFSFELANANMPSSKSSSSKISKSSNNNSPKSTSTSDNSNKNSKNNQNNFKNLSIPQYDDLNGSANMNEMLKRGNSDNSPSSSSSLPPPAKRVTVIQDGYHKDNNDNITMASISSSNKNPNDIKYRKEFLKYCSSFKNIIEVDTLRRIWNSFDSLSEEDHANDAMDFTLNLVSDNEIQDRILSTRKSDQDNLCQNLIDLTIQDDEFLPSTGTCYTSSNKIKQVSSSSSTSSSSNLNFYHYLQANLYEKSKKQFTLGKGSRTAQEAAIEAVLKEFENEKLRIKKEEVIGILINNHFDIDLTIKQVKATCLVGGNCRREGVSYSDIASTNTSDEIKSSSIRIAPVPTNGYKLKDLFNYNDEKRMESKYEFISEVDYLREENVPIIDLKLSKSLSNINVYTTYNDYSFEVIKRLNPSYKFKIVTKHYSHLTSTSSSTSFPGSFPYEVIEFNGFSNHVNIDDLLHGDYKNTNYINLKEFDFHGLPVLQMLQITESILDYFNDIKNNLVKRLPSKFDILRSNIIILRFIVGKGLHSHKNIPKLGPALMHYLNQKNYENYLPYEGEITLTLR